MAIQSVVENHLWFLMSFTPFFRLPNLFVRSTWSRFLSRSFRSELKWEGNRTYRSEKRSDYQAWSTQRHVFLPFLIWYAELQYVKLDKKHWRRTANLMLVVKRQAEKWMSIKILKIFSNNFKIGLSLRTLPDTIFRRSGWADQQKREGNQQPFHR